MKVSALTVFYTVKLIKQARNRHNFGYFRGLHILEILAINTSERINLVRASLGKNVYRIEHFFLIHSDLC